MRIKSGKELRKEPQQDRARATWEAILEGASQVFADGGYEQFTIARVAERAGVSAGSIYQYIDTSDVLIARIGERWLNDLYDVSKAASERTRGESLEVRLRAALTAFISHKRESMALSIRLSELALKQEDARRTLAVAMGFGERLLAEIYRDVTDEQSATQCGVIAMATVHGVIERLVSEGAELEQSELVPRLLRMLLAVVRTETRSG